MDGDGVRVWDRLPGEPTGWFDRFEIYRALGPDRSIEQCYHAWVDAAGGSAKAHRGPRPSRHWYAAAHRYDWTGGAHAYDDNFRQQLRAAEADQRFDARRRRLALVGGLLEGVGAALSRLDFDQLTVDEVRELLPTLRIMLKDLVQMERLEFGEASEIVEDTTVLEVAADVRAALARAYGE